MINKDPSAINSCLPPAAPEVVVLPADQYLALLNHVQQLQKIIEIYIGPNMSILNEPPDSDWIAALKRKRDAQNDYGPRLTELEDRIAELEKRTPSKPKPAEGKVTEQRLLKLSITLLNRNNQPISYVEISKLLELGSRSADGKKTTRKQNMTHLAKRIEAAQDRFVVKADSQGHKYAHLKKVYYDHLKKEYLG